MKEVTAAVKPVSDAVLTGVKLEVEAARKAWSLMEAATEKRQPSEVMSQGAVKRMQGKQIGG